jgi:ActR/RegA family two-component response regulator
MTDTLRILDYYRLPLAHDESAFETIAVLTRAGALGDEELARAIGKGIAQTRLLIQKLFRASLVRTLDERYDLTELGRVYAVRFGLERDALASIVEESGVETADKRFLSACHAFREYHAPENSGRALKHLRTWSTMFAGEVLKPKEGKRIQKRIMYSIIAGGDPQLHVFGADRYCDAVISFAPEGPLGLRQDVYVEPKASSRKGCEIARVDYANSDRLLYFGEMPSKSTQIDAAFVLVLLRAMSAILERVPLGLAGRTISYDPRLASSLLRMLTEWRPNVAVLAWRAIEHSAPSVAKTAPEGTPRERFEGLLDDALRVIYQSEETASPMDVSASPEVSLPRIGRALTASRTLSKGRRVLIVDNDASALSSLTDTLMRAGYDVIGASSGDDALALLSTTSVDILLLELRLPDTRGDVVFELAAATHPHLRTQTILMSTDTSARASALVERCSCPFLEKPVDVYELLRILKAMFVADQDADLVRPA